MLPFAPQRPQQLTPYFALAQRTPLARVWSGQSLTVTPDQLFTYMSGLGLGVAAGLGVTLAPLRHPFDAAAQARSLAVVTGRPVVAGYGSGTPELVEALHGSAYRSPRTAMAEYLRAVRGFLDQDSHPPVPLPELPHPPVELGLGVLRPGLARTAGAVADVAVTWLCPPWYLRDTIVPALRAGAADAGRDAPRVAAVVHLALDKDGRDPHQVAFTATGAHLRGAHYVDMLNRAGVAADAADPIAGARALLDAGVFVTGDAAAVAKRLDEYRLAGVDEVVLNVGGVALLDGVRASVAELAAVVGQLTGGPS